MVVKISVVKISVGKDKCSKDKCSKDKDKCTKDNYIDINCLIKKELKEFEDKIAVLQLEQRKSI